MKPELILPGGDLERVKIAFLYGADAVYVGLNKYSLRKAEIRFSLSEIEEAVLFAHKINKRILVTFNIFAHNKDLEDMKSDMAKIAVFKPDAFIISDPGVLSLARKVAPDIPIHLSTQANSLNIETVRFWQRQGVKRIVLARELSLDEIKEIHKQVPDIELEIFVHGAMCISYSGRCLLSHYMTGRSANLGDCAQPCRWEYKVYLEEKMRPGEYYPIEEDQKGTYFMGSKDLRLIRYLPEILASGVTGLKVEGRNKSEYYLATTARAYRQALFLLSLDKYSEKEKKRLEDDLEKLNNRDYTTGFAFGDAKLGEVSEKRTPRQNWQYLGIVSGPENEVLVKNKIEPGDDIEVMTPMSDFNDRVACIIDGSGKQVAEINPGKKDQKARLKLSKEYQTDAIIRKKL